MPKKKKNKKASSKPKSSKKRTSNWRTTALFLLLLTPAFGLVARLYYLQIIRGDYYGALAVGQKIDISAPLPPRGEIFFQDKAGASKYIAAINKEVPLVYADPGEIKSGEEVMDKIGSIAEIKPEDKDAIFERLNNKDSSYALIARHLTEDQANKIKELELDGIYIKNEVVRFYPAGNLASHALGFLGFNSEGQGGQYGVEKQYDDLLSGKSIQGFSFSNIIARDGDAAADIELTIDYGVQFAVEKKLQELYEKWQPESASALFMDPQTGEILAMAHIPNFNPNEYSKTEEISTFNNPIVQSRFELGSVFKPITIAAGIDSGAISPTTTYEDTGSVTIGSYTIRNSDLQSHGVQTMAEALEKSLNTGMIFAQEQTGKKKFKEYLEAFQLGQETGIDLPGDISGNIDNIKNTNRDINYATASFGQGISFSTLRFLSSISAIANNGVIMKPYVVNSIDQNGEIIETEQEELGEPISSITASKVTAMMVSVVENGFGSKAAVPGYSVAGKTGTAQIPHEDKSGYSDKTIQSFVGFAPAYNPKFIGIIQLNDPKGIRFASDSVAPAFGDLASFILQYYNVPPQ